MRSFVVPLVFAALGAHAALTPTPTKRDDSSLFASTKNGQLIVNGSEFRFVGTNAYWLPFLNTDEDIDNVLGNMSAAGISVVRTWAFNDVTSIPAEGSWLQLIANGTTQINNGTNGLQRLDKLVELAANHGIYVIFSLTNNWNPIANETDADPMTPSAPSSTPLPRNFLSNDYGGMDAYVREFGVAKTHDEFYLNMTIREIFENYTSAVVTRFVNNPWVFSWELANDPRCNSSVATADTCNTNTVTQWHADVADFVKSIDPNHLVSSGDQGFSCATCPKLFPLNPSPSPSATANNRRKRAAVAAVSKSRLAKKVSEARRRSAKSVPADGVRIRGRWVANKEAKRQAGGSSTVGSAFDGSSGVDSQDILNAPNIGFGSFQYFPDQNSYAGPGQPVQPTNFSDLVQQGIDWINQNAANAQAVGKPLTLTGFGLVTQDNFQFFVPFNSTTPPPANATNTTNPVTGGLVRRADVPFGVTDPSSTIPQTAINGTNGVTVQQQSDAYQAWFNAALNAGVNGAFNYQWGAGNLTSLNGTIIQQPENANSTVAVGSAPNDGYGGVSQQQSLNSTITQAAQNFSVSVGGF